MRKLIILLLLICNLFITSSTSLVSADSSAGTSTIIEYSDVLTDLQNDSTFKEEEYIQDITNPTITILNLAESVDKELFVYTYQPSASTDIYAMSINISCGRLISYTNKELELVSTNGVFFKYKIKDFIIPNESIRVYYIASIFRNFNSNYDKNEIEENPIDEISIKVAKTYTFQDFDNQTLVNVSDIEVIEVTNKYAGFVRYENGFDLNISPRLDSHFVAFSTDKPIDKLISAKVSFVNHRIKETCFNGDITELDVVKDEVYLYYKDKVNFKGNGFFATEYSWDRIQDIDTFVNNIKDLPAYTILNNHILDLNVYYEIKGDKLDLLKQNKWVLRYLETEYQHIPGNSTIMGNLGGAPVYNSYDLYNRISGITILQLEFETDGKTYNLGVIDNKNTEDSSPVNRIDKPGPDSDWFGLVLFILLVIGIILLFIYFPPIFNLFVNLLTYLLKAIIFLLKWIGKGLYYAIIHPIVLLFKKIFNKD